MCNLHISAKGSHGRLAARRAQVGATACEAPATLRHPDHYNTEYPITQVASTYINMSREAREPVRPRWIWRDSGAAPARGVAPSRRSCSAGMASSAPAAAPSRTAARIGAKPVRNLCACAGAPWGAVLKKGYQRPPHHNPTAFAFPSRASHGLVRLRPMGNCARNIVQHPLHHGPTACAAPSHTSSAQAVTPDSG